MAKQPNPIIEAQYQKYLKLVALDESNMAEIQKRQLRQTFFAAAGQLIIYMRDEIAVMDDEDAAADVLQGMLDEVGQYFNQVNHRNN